MKGSVGRRRSKILLSGNAGPWTAKVVKLTLIPHTIPTTIWRRQVRKAHAVLSIMTLRGTIAFVVCKDALVERRPFACRLVLISIISEAVPSRVNGSRTWDRMGLTFPPQRFEVGLGVF